MKSNIVFLTLVVFDPLRTFSLLSLSLSSFKRRLVKGSYIINGRLHSDGRPPSNPKIIIGEGYKIPVPPVSNFKESGPINPLNLLNQLSSQQG